MPPDRSGLTILNRGVELKKILSPVLKSLAGAVVVLLLMEVAVRLFLAAPIDLLQLNEFVESERGKFAQYDPTLGWVGKPAVTDDFQWVDTSHKVAQNRFGFRGVEYEQIKSDKHRILVLGDSFVWGFGVQNDQIFTNVMEKASAGSVEVVNCGVSGYGNDQEYLYWKEHGYKWQPDEVVLVITPYTDIVDNLFDKRYGYAKPRFIPVVTADAPPGKPPILKLTNVPVPRGGKFGPGAKTRISHTPIRGLPLRLGNLHLAKMMVNAAASKESWRRGMEDSGLIPRRLPGYDWEYPLFETRPTQQVQQGWMMMFALMNMLKTDVEAHGAKLTVAIVPSISQVYPELWARFAAARKKGNGSPLDPENPNRRITAWCKANGVSVVDLLPALRQAGQQNSFLYFPYNLHWTAAGHLIVAEELLPAIAAP